MSKATQRKKARQSRLWTGELKGGVIVNAPEVNFDITIPESYFINGDFFQFVGYKSRQPRDLVRCEESSFRIWLLPKLNLGDQARIFRNWVMPMGGPHHNEEYPRFHLKVEMSHAAEIRVRHLRLSMPAVSMTISIHIDYAPHASRYDNEAGNRLVKEQARVNEHARYLRWLAYNCSKGCEDERWVQASEHEGESVRHYYVRPG